MTRVAARLSSKVVTTPAANTKRLVSSSNMGRRGMSASVPAMATAMSAMTSTSKSRRSDYQKSCHHERSKC
jgi:hypothetical protein